MQRKTWITWALAMAGVFAAPFALAQDKLTVWWGKGFYKAEDDALFAAIKKFEAKNKNVKIELSLYAPQEMIPKSVAALDAGNPPDVAYGDVYDFQVTAKWAYDGKLEDISSLIDPIRARFEPAALSTTFLFNNAAQNRAYYAFPIKQQTMHIQYWKDMLADAGFKDSDIPQDLEGVLGLLVRQGAGRLSPENRQPRVRHRLPDWGRFERLVLFVPDLHGRLQRQTGERFRQAARRRPRRAPGADERADRLHAGVHQRLHAAVVDELEGSGQQRGVPQQDDRTHPQRNDIDRRQVARRHEQRHPHRCAARHSEEELHRVDRHGRVPQQTGRHQDDLPRRGEDRRDLQGREEQGDGQAVRQRSCSDEANLTPYVEGSLGRWFPVTKGAQQSAFWKSDPHRLAVYNQFMAGTTPFEFTKNYKFTVLNNENVWAKAMNRILNEKVPVDKATDELIARIKAVAN